LEEVQEIFGKCVEVKVEYKINQNNLIINLLEMEK
jgi:hypothetical protein